MYQKIIKMLSFISISLSFVLVYNGFAQEKDARIIKVGVYENHPKVYTDKNGNITGLFPDIVNSIAESEGWSIEYVLSDWTESLNKLERGEINMMVDVAISEERIQRFDFNEETIFISFSTIYTKPNETIESYLDLKDKNIAVMKGSINYVGKDGIRKILENFNIPATFIEYKSYHEVFEAVQFGKANAGVVNSIFGTLFENNYKLFRSPIVFNPSQLRFAFTKNSDIGKYLISRVDTVLQNAKKDKNSFYYEALNKHIYGQVDSKGQALVSKTFQVLQLTDQEKEWIKTHKTIRIGIDPEFVPFEYRDANGIYRGLASDYVSLLNERLGLDMKVVQGLPWKEVIERTKAKEIDVLPCVGITEERKNYLLFSKPYVSYHRVILTQSDTPFIIGVDDLYDKKVGAQEGSSHEGFLRDRTTIQPITFKTLKEGLMALSGGSIDAFVANIASASYWIQQLNLSNLKVAAPASFEVFTLHFAVRKDWPELIEIINKGLDSISIEEEQTIQRRWVKLEYKPGFEPRIVWNYIIRASLVIFLVFLITLFWSYRLKKENTLRKQIEKKLSYRERFERLISEMSSRFIGFKPKEIDSQIHAAITEIVYFLEADHGFIFSINKDQAPVCLHHVMWHFSKVSISENISLLYDSWVLDKLRAGNVIIITSEQDMHQESSMSWEKLMDMGIKSIIVVPCSYQGEFTGFLGLITTDVTKKWLDEEISLIRLAGQIFTNALERKKSEEALEQYAKELETANEHLKDIDRLKNMFIASVSHELRTPLNSIIGFTGIILKGMTGELNPKQKDQLSRVYGSANHLLSLITDVIDISKIEAGRIDIFPQPFRLVDVMKDAISSIQTQIQAKSLELQFDVPDTIEINTDKKRFQQCMLNYLSNAVKYTEHGSVSVKARESGEMIEINVTDTGIGIAREDMNRLFEPFERLDSHLRVKAGGTGLGLYLTRKIATELLKGELHVASELGKGSTFTMIIPKDITAFNSNLSSIKKGEV
ncbi:MAG: transporter substrate-binding domain-containing protein [Desulfobacterales bacterium]|nr:transporter substrate-binding domain-containing protein [Desulfobacterales bacterium]